MILLYANKLKIYFAMWKKAAKWCGDAVKKIKAERERVEQTDTW